MDYDIVTTQYASLAEEGGLQLQHGGTLPSCILAYETYGSLNDARDNAIVLLHSFTSHQHAAGYHANATEAGWWHELIGPGKPLDTDRFYIICSNVLGGCHGSTGPSSINPETGKPYGSSFPSITMTDIVRTQKRLLDQLGIASLYAVIGGSMGGMQVLQWVTEYPHMIARAIAIATTARLSPMVIALNELAIKTIQADPQWCHGDYYGAAFPTHGFTAARVTGQAALVYAHQWGLSAQAAPTRGFRFGFTEQVETASTAMVDAGAPPFDANSYLVLLKAMNAYDIETGFATLAEAFQQISARFQVIAFSSDGMFPPEQSRELVDALQTSGHEVEYHEIQTPLGHDAFLITPDILNDDIRNILR